MKYPGITGFRNLPPGQKDADPGPPARTDPFSQDACIRLFSKLAALAQLVLPLQDDLDAFEAAFIHWRSGLAADEYREWAWLDCWDKLRLLGIVSGEKLPLSATLRTVLGFAQERQRKMPAKINLLQHFASHREDTVSPLRSEAIRMMERYLDIKPGEPLPDYPITR